MKKLIISVFSIISLAFCANCEELTFEQCLDLAKENNLKIRSAEHLVKAAEYDFTSSRALFFPNITATGIAVYSAAKGTFSTPTFNLPVLNGTGQYTGDFVNVPSLDIDYKFGWLFNGSVKIEQPVYMGGKIRAGYNIAKSAKELYLQNKRLTEADIILETATAYTNLVRATQMKQVALSYKTLLTELHSDVQKAFKHGLKPKNDVLKVEVKLNEAELNLRKAENACRLASMNLCHYIGRPLNDSITVSSTDIVHNQVQVSTDFSARPETQILDYKEYIAQQKVNIARSEYLPQIGLIGQYGYTDGLKLGGKKVLEDWNYLVGIQVSIPIYDFGHRIGKIRSAKEQLAAVKAEKDDTNQLLALSLHQAINNLDEAYLEVELAQSSVIAADENLRSSTKFYQAGMESLSDNLEAQTLWQQAHATLIEAQTSLFLRHIEYLRATGQLN